MNLTDLIVIGVLVLAALLGFMLGFGKSLKLTTRGILGIVISIAACIMFGGAVKSFAPVSAFIENVDKSFEGMWGFLGFLHLGTVIYYVGFFVAIQLVKMIAIKIICGIDSAGGKGFRLISKTLGAVFVVGFCFSLCLLGLAGLKAFENSNFAVDVLDKIQDSFLMTLYTNNPIAF